MRFSLPPVQRVVIERELRDLPVARGVPDDDLDRLAQLGRGGPDVYHGNPPLEPRTKRPARHHAYLLPSLVGDLEVSARDPLLHDYAPSDSRGPLLHQ